MVERNALDPTKIPGHVTMDHAQWTGAGVSGASAVQHVAVALRREGEPVPIPLRQMVVLVVLETTWRLKAVTLILAQWMVAGAIGPRGVNVTSPVVKARNSEIAPAPTHPPQATEASVKENLSRARSVK